MRIISQKGLRYINLPYEEVGISMQINDVESTYSIYAFSVTDTGIWQMAKYSNQKSAIRALNDMNDAFVEIKKNTDHEGRQQMYKMEKIWRFPNDGNANDIR